MRTIIIVLLSCCAACAVYDDQCVENRAELDYDDPGPWGESAADRYAHAEGPRAGTLTWNGGADLGALEPSTGQAPVTIELVLDKDSAVGVDLEHVGGGRLACVDRIELVGTLSINSDDGALSESIELELRSEPGTVGNEITGHADLSDHSFAGSLTWSPISATQELFIRVSYIDDASGTARGWLIWGDRETTSVSAETVTVEGSGRVLAEFEAKS